MYTRKRHWLSRFAILTMALLTTPGEAGESQTDSDGRIANSSEWPWQAIGRVNISGATFCTGTLVAPDTVLTAAHCLNNRITGKHHLPDYVTFVVGYSRGSYVAQSKAASFSVKSCAPKVGETVSYEALACDSALIKLATPIQNVEPLQQAESVPENGSGVLAGYLQSRPYALSILDCTIVSRDQPRQLLYHSCSWIEGGSGGPFLTHVNGTWRVFGIQTAKSKLLDGQTIGIARRWISGD